jgi:hypothetical protein
MHRFLVRLLLTFALALPLGLAVSNTAWASSASEVNPAANFPAGAMPTACTTSPDSTPCVNAAVYYLDQARASLGQGPYALPNDFPSLTPAQQAFILTNLDRILYGLAPVPGLTADLDSDSYISGVAVGDDPNSSNPNFFTYAANWAGAYTNMPLAYEAWMYDDGLDSGNIDCTATNLSGCWGHRQGVLIDFSSSWNNAGLSLLAMGAATGTGPTSPAYYSPGYAMIIAAGYSSYQPVYVYTWTQALADGAGSNTYDPGLPQIPVTVAATAQGPGSVSDSNDNSCTNSTCSWQETQGVQTSFTAEAADGAVFVGWQGGCTGIGACTITPSGGSTVTAIFKTAPTQKPPSLSMLSLSAHGQTVAVKLSCQHTQICSGLINASVLAVLTPNNKIISVTTKPGHGKHSKTVAACAFTVKGDATTTVSCTLNVLGQQLLKRFRRLPSTVNVSAGKQALAAKKLLVFRATK